MVKTKISSGKCCNIQLLYKSFSRCPELSCIFLFVPDEMFLETVGERRAHQPSQSAIGMTGDDDVSDFQCSDAINK